VAVDATAAGRRTLQYARPAAAAGFHGSELAVVYKELAVEALLDRVVARLMTISGVGAIAGISIVAAVGDFHRFDDPDRLIAYIG
jgi:transposase